MYAELGGFLAYILSQRSIWKDGELWTAVLISLGSAATFHDQPALMGSITAHFGDLLSVVSILFGFILTALIFYVQAAEQWKKNLRISRAAGRLVDWHVWTLLGLLATIGLILIIWSINALIAPGGWLRISLFGVLVFLLAYTSFQILNHALTVWWIKSELQKMTP